MTEQEWLESDHPLLVLEHLGGDLSSRKWRLVVCAACRRVWDRLPDQSQMAVSVAERFADSEVDANTLALAHAAAWPLVTTARDTAYYPGQAALSASCPVPDRIALYYANPAAPAAAPGREAERRARIMQGFAENCNHLRDIFGNPFRPAAFNPAWRTSTVVTLASQMYESRDFDAMPILADALQDAGCTNEDVLNHCRGPGPHVRGCWVVDLVLGKS